MSGVCVILPQHTTSLAKISFDCELCASASKYGSNRYVGASLDAWEGPKTFTSCPEAWHTIEDILEDGFDAITLVPYE